jgi:hypothetical protein
LGKSEAARAWEDSSDMAIAPWTSGEISKTWPLETVEQNPWLAKVDPGSKVYEPRRAAVEGLGFDHLIDELRNATRADSDLPANLRWKPEDLKKVTVPQAVERVAKINEWRAAQKAEADAAKARNPATFTFKEYPEKGMQWVELATPSKLPEKFTVSENRGRFNVVDSATGNPLLLGRGQTLTSFKTPEEAVSAYYKQNPNVLEEALKYEGEVMGHCVGGYCPDVLEGRSRIYSLRDKKGEPHVTIEVQPNNADRNSAYIDFLRDDRRNQGGAFTEWLQKKVDADPSFQKMEALSVANMFRAENGLPPIEVITPPPKIVQIKGKGNKAPKEEYLPMVQDFVRSGNWSRVGDLHNTQLIAVDPGSELANALQTAGKKVPQYVTQDELTKLLAWNRGEGDVPQGYARGGLVKDTDVIAAKLKATGMDDQKAFMQALRMADARQEAHMAGGGLAKLLKGAAKAEDVAKVAKEAHPTILPPVAPLTKEQMRPIAQRVASQMTGEFVRPDPKLSINPAGKSKKVFQRERDLPVEVTEKIPQKSVEPFDIEKYEGYGLVGVPGDPTLGGVAKPGSLSQIHEGAAELKRLGDVEFEHPVQLFGGPRYGAYSPNDEFWASNIGPARAIQNRVTALSQAIDAPVLGEYIKMAPESTNFALHNLDALLSYMQPEKLGKKKLQELNAEIRKGSPKYGKFPGFSGFEDPVDVLLQSQIHSDLRKHIAETLMKPTVAEKFGMRPGSDVLFGISKPELRELEPGISGYSIGQMKPRAELTPSLHPTYDFDIPGTFLGSSKYPTPYEVAFPASTAYTRSQLKPGVQEFNMLKMVGPRERIDPQYIDQIKMYEELMKEYTGKKKGGLVKKSGLSVLNKAII